MQVFEDRSRGSYTAFRITLFLGLCGVSWRLSDGWGVGLFAICCLRWTLMTGLDSRRTACLSLGALLMIIFYLLLNNESIANARAVLLYYLLCVTTGGSLYQGSQMDRKISYRLDHQGQQWFISSYTAIKHILIHLWSYIMQHMPLVSRLIQTYIHKDYRYLYISIIIRGPWLLHSGYLVSLDRLPLIVRSLSDVQIPWVLFPTIAWAWSKLGLPVWMINNIFWILPLVLGAYYTHRLLKSHPRYAQVFAVLLFLCNPFIYARMADGQLNVVWMTMGLVMWMVFIQEHIKHIQSGGSWRTWKYILRLVISMIVIPMFSIHSIFGLGLIYIVWYGASRLPLRQIGYTYVIGIAALCVTNIYRIIPTLSGSNETGATIQQMGDNHRDAFMTQAAGTSVYRNTLSMRGYRGESQQRFLPHYLFNPNYHLIMIVLFLLICIGRYRQYQTQSSQAYAYLLLGLIAWILSHGAQGIFGPLSNFLYEYIPGYAGLREPHKWVALLVIVYAYIGALGLVKVVDILYKHDIQPWISRSIMIILIGLPLLYSPAMLFGLWGQIKPVHHPETRTEVQHYMTQVPSSKSCTYQSKYPQAPCYRALILPRHGYMTISRVNKRVGTWLTHYFGDQILIGDPVEFGGIYTQTVRPSSLLIQQYINNQSGFVLPHASDAQQFIQDLKSMGISELIMLKEVDRNLYQSGLTQLKPYIAPMIDNTHVQVYHIRP